MAGHTNNAAMNESWEIKQMRVDSDILRNQFTYASDVERLTAELAELRTLIADYQKAGDSAREMEAQNKALRAENARMIHQHDEMAAHIMEADVLGMKYKEECERQIEKHTDTVEAYAELTAHLDWAREDGKRLQAEVERLKSSAGYTAVAVIESDTSETPTFQEFAAAKDEVVTLRAEVDRLRAENAELKATEQEAYELTMRTTTELVELRDENAILKVDLAVRERAMEIWESYGMDNCPNPNVSVHGDKGCPQELDCTKCIHEFSLKKARAELEHSKPKAKFRPAMKNVIGRPLS